MKRRYPDNAKLVRVLDIAISASLLAFLFPLMVTVAIVIRIVNGKDVLFIQRRMGAFGRSFGCIKFRTMRRDASQHLSVLIANDPVLYAQWSDGQKLINDPRVTLVGRFLRTTSIDELPQLWNVLRGDMSVVGPRPITAGEARRYGVRYFTYCRVRPGLTGLWQVSGRCDVRYRRRIAMDVAFARNHSVALYVSILSRTPRALFARSGAY